jgi:RimJ/RimL family protein N-acetyltransferase
MKPEIETARLRLRMFTLDDLEDLKTALGDPDVMSPLGISAELDFSLILSKMIELWQRDDIGRWAVVNKDDNNLIGICGFRLLEGEPELLYAIAKPFWGRGFASEAAKAALRFGFEEKNFERIVATTKQTNVASLRVLYRIGMRDEKKTTPHGIDRVVYTITSDNFSIDDSPYLLSYKYNKDVSEPSRSEY